MGERRPSMGDSDNDSHWRLVTLGGSAVGKSSILKRFLFGTYNERHRPTVEDLYSREFDIAPGTQLKVTFLDTAGDMQFPAMRRLSIANGQAFLLVYSVDSEASFCTVKQCFEEIKEQKPDFQELPIMVVGNKCDIPDEKRMVKKDDVNDWVLGELPKLRAKVLECSAKENSSIKDIFKSFLQLAKIALPADTHGLRRRSSTHVGNLTKPLRFNASLSPQREQAESSPESSSSPKPPKPRSRSLIRRTSKKLSKLKDSMTSAGSSTDQDCHIS